MEEGSEGLFSTLFGKFFRNKDDFSMEEFINTAVKEGDLRSDESIMCLNVLRLGRRQVHEIMIPRTDIVCADIKEPLPAMAELIVETGHSRIPIYNDNRDNIVGIVHAKDLMRDLLNPEGPKSSIRELMREPIFIPDTKVVRDMLNEFRQKKVHLAIALDEYGGTSGLVTFEDVLEEIVGEIEDEYDEPRSEEVTMQEDGNALVSGRAGLECLADGLDLHLASEHVETLSGYLCEMLGRVPSPGETFDINGRKVTIKEADAKQIYWLVVEHGDSCNTEPSV